MEELAHYPEVLAAAATYIDQRARLEELCLQVQRIPAPTGAEGLRANWIEEEFRRLGPYNVFQDELFNVYAHLVGRGHGPAVLVSAHTDTVFAADTDLSVSVDRQAMRISGPGIGDNSTGVAALLALACTLASLPTPPVDVWLVANSAEEGLGDLRGMRAVMVRLKEKIGASIVVEGMGLGRIVHRALGSRRYRITATAPGGHSWSDFGTASAVHTLVQLGADISRLRMPAEPRTTFNIGRIGGGMSVNTIAQTAWMELDLRSEGTDALSDAIRDVENLVSRYQSPRWKNRGVEVVSEQIGNRPTGEIDAGHPLVQAAARSLETCGYPVTVDLRISSTDANVPLSQGIPAVCVGITEGGNAHRMEEWIKVAPLPHGLRHLLFLTWWSAAWQAGELP